MPHTKCPLCDADVRYSVSKSYPETRWEPAGGGDIEDIEPECECVNARCVDEGKYYEMIEEAIRDRGIEVEDDSDARYEAWRDR